MRIRRFHAAHMTEALRQVRETLGPEAVILEAKGTQTDGGSPKGVMVLAAVDRHLETRPEAPPSFHNPEAPRGDEQPHPTPPEPAASVREPSVPTTAPPPREKRPARPVPAPQPAIEADVGLQQEVERLTNRVSYMSRLIVSDHFSSIPVPLRELYLNLIEAEVDSNLAFAVLRAVAAERPPDMVSGPQIEPLRRRLVRIVPRGESIAMAPGRRVALMVGPPGSGKSSATAALAASALRAGRRPGLISLDTFRVAGPASLQHYARVLGLPFATVFEPRDLLEAAGRGLSECDLVLVDTPGITAMERDALAAVRGCMNHLTAPEVHLVLSASSKVRDSATALRLFAEFTPKSIVFTKLDATNSYGGILSLTLKARIPVSHMNWGRRILEDLRDCDPEGLVSMVLEQCEATSWEAPAPESMQPSMESVKEAV